MIRRFSHHSRLFLIAALLAPAAAHGSSMTMMLNIEFSGGSNPAGPGPWLQAGFADSGVNMVDLTLQGLLSQPTEFVGVWMFNLDPALDPALLQFVPIAGGPTATVSTGVNAFQADGDGRFDIKFDFPQAPPSGRFKGTDSVTYRISSTQPINASSFNFLSAPAGGAGPFPTAAHVQGIGPNGDFSGWITVPEPATLSLLALAALVRRRR